MGISWALIASSWAAGGVSGQATGAVFATSPLIEFDIPAQPLETALFQYGETSRAPALFPSELAIGLRSAPLRGRHSPDDGLQRLLQGTGLVAEKMSTAHGDVFRIRRAATSPLTASVTDLMPNSGGRELDGYPARVQAGVLRALCSEPLTVPGSYRALVEVQIGAAGQVNHAALVEPTGERRRDAALLVALHRIRMGVSPPTGVASVSYTVTLLTAVAGDPPPCRAQTDDVS